MAKTRMMLVTAVETLDEEKVERLVKIGLERGADPLDIIEDVRQGMERVGYLYKQEKYYIADLIMASLIFQRVLTIIPSIHNKQNKDSCLKSQVVIGTVEGDIHDIGKNITVGLLRARGVGVVDMGVDVPPESFIKAVQENGAKILGLSGLLTSSYELMRTTTQSLKELGLRSDVQVMIGGLVNNDVREYVGADYCATDCAFGVKLCQRILNIDVDSLPPLAGVL
ncbi:MAG: cobalamin-dependent protein [Syntrophaceticus sp.]|nr:cobalamin-dependent protein [Syntrophaceticus sp.]MDD4783425.1 cobalamin-dependent protein [Syntrophaceticus sp.]